MKIIRVCCEAASVEAVAVKQRSPRHRSARITSRVLLRFARCIRALLQFNHDQNANCNKEVVLVCALAAGGAKNTHNTPGLGRARARRRERPHRLRGVTPRARVRAHDGLNLRRTRRLKFAWCHC